MSGGTHIGDVVFGPKTGGDTHVGDRITLGLGRPAAAPPHRNTILVLSANPRFTSPLQIGEEKRTIDHAITLARADERVETRSVDSVRRSDLQLALTNYRPTVTHFIGHGHAGEGIVLVDRYGLPQSAPPAAVAELFRILAGQVRCVVLNACFTEVQAFAIARHIPCVVGMTGQVSDAAAIDFADSFYQAAAAGCPIQDAFDLACNSLTMAGHAHADRPVLVDIQRVARQITIID